MVFESSYLTQLKESQGNFNIWLDRIRIPLWASSEDTLIKEKEINLTLFRILDFSIYLLVIT